MKLKKKIFLAASLVSLAVFVVIFIFSEGKEREVKNLIIAYNRVIPKAHLDMNAGLMTRLTSEWQLKKIDSYIAFNLKNKRTVQGELIDLQFKDVAIDGNTATVTTIERWLWSYVDPQTKQPVSKQFNEVYGNTYHLKRTEGHWIVDDLESNLLGGKHD